MAEISNIQEQLKHDSPHFAKCYEALQAWCKAVLELKGASLPEKKTFIFNPSMPANKALYLYEKWLSHQKRDDLGGFWLSLDEENQTIFCEKILEVDNLQLHTFHRFTLFALNHQPSQILTFKSLPRGVKDYGSLENWLAIIQHLLRFRPEEAKKTLLKALKFR